MHPSLTDAAAEVLRRLPVDDLYVLEHVRPCNELIDKGVLALDPDGHAHLTTLGARMLLGMLVDEELAVECRCGAPRRAHAGPSPHDCPETGCRAFTPSTPVYTKPASDTIRSAPVFEDLDFLGKARE